MRKLVLFLGCIGLTSFAFSQVPVSPSYKPPPPHKPPPRLLPPPPKPKLESFVYNSSGELEWRGTVEEAERAFTTSLENEVDVVRDRESKKSITGHLTILDTNGKPQGKLELKDGKLHGEEIFYDEDGNIVEENYWIEGKLSKTPPPRVKETKIQNTEDDSAKKPRPKFDPFAERPQAEIKDISNPNSSIKPKIIHNLVSDKNSSKPSVVPTPPLSLANQWSDFTYDSPEEKAFWDKLPDWSSKGLSFTNFRFKRNALGETIESNSSEGFDGYVKCHNWVLFDLSYRTLYQFVDGYVVKEKSWSNKGQKKSENTYKEGKFDGLHTEWYFNGQKKRESTYKDDKFDGLDTEWYFNGQKRYELNYKDEKLSTAKVWLPDGKECLEAKVIDGNGVVIYYDEDGQKHREHNYKDGKYDGLLTWWYKNGQKMSESSYKDGKREGLTTSWGKNGHMREKVNWKDGKQDGLTTKFFENGQKWWEQNYKEGKFDGLHTMWHKNGQKKREITYKDDKFNGLDTEWYLNGQKRYELNYKVGKRDGLHTEWFENGQKKEELNYKVGKRDGLWTKWYYNGQKEYERHYKDEERHGLSTIWYQDGQKELEEKYKVGKLDGLLTRWYENGQKKEEVNYKDGERDGLLSRWYENGQKKEEGNYKNGKRLGVFKEWDENGTLIRTGRSINPPPRIRPAPISNQSTPNPHRIPTQPPPPRR